MEAKLSHSRRVLAWPNQTTFPSHSFSLKRHFRGLAKKWRIQIQEVSNGPHSSKYLLVHVVKQGETLTSISKQYGVSVYTIAAANKNIVDVDLVFEGQRLNIPSSSRGKIQVTEKNRLFSFDVQESYQHSMNIFGGLLENKNFAMQIVYRLPHNVKNRLSSFGRETYEHSLNTFDGLLDKKNFTMQTVHSFPHAKTTGYFLVLVPLIAFCIRCIIAVLHTRIAGDSKRRAVNRSNGHPHGSKSMRWKSALSDITETDVLDPESRPDSNGQSEDQITCYEERSRAYSKLQDDYEKFLSECGMSKWGYWRGGSPE